MNVPIPDLPPYNPARDEKFPWEDDVAAAIAKLRAKKKAKKKGEGSAEHPTLSDHYSMSSLSILGKTAQASR
jgi:hypothetical protein